MLHRGLFNSQFHDNLGNPATFVQRVICLKRIGIGLGLELGLRLGNLTIWESVQLHFGQITLRTSDL